MSAVCVKIVWDWEMLYRTEVSWSSHNGSGAAAVAVHEDTLSTAVILTVSRKFISCSSPCCEVWIRTTKKNEQSLERGGMVGNATHYASECLSNQE